MSVVSPYVVSREVERLLGLDKAELSWCYRWVPEKLLYEYDFDYKKRKFGFAVTMDDMRLDLATFSERIVKPLVFEMKRDTP